MTAVSKKVCLLGEYYVGKTSLVRRFVYNRFDDAYISTIGVRVSRKTVSVPRDGEPVELTMMLWDLAGSEEFTRVRASYLRGSAGAILVCDLTRPKTLESLRDYAEDLLGLSPDARLVIAANKRDLVEQRQVSDDDVSTIAGGLRAHHYLTSALTGDEVDVAFRQLGMLLLG